MPANGRLSRSPVYSFRPPHSTQSNLVDQLINHSKHIYLCDATRRERVQAPVCQIGHQLWFWWRCVGSVQRRCGLEKSWGRMLQFSNRLQLQISESIITIKKTDLQNIHQVRNSTNWVSDLRPCQFECSERFLTSNDINMLQKGLV